MSGGKPLTEEPVNEEYIDLGILFSALWQGKWLILFVSGIFFVSALILAFSLPDEYRATLVLQPAADSSSSLTKIASQFGGLASLAGLSVGRSGPDQTAISLEVLKSWAFQEEFIEKYGLAPDLVAAKSWDEEAGLVYDPDIFNSSVGEWVGEYAEKDNKKLSGWVLYQKLSDRIEISEDISTGIIRLSVEHYSPEVALSWANLLLKELNDKIRARAVEEAQNSIRYLENQIGQTAIKDLQEVFYRLIEEQTKTLMLAQASNEYALKIVSPAMLPQEPSKPNRALICIAFTMAGGLLGVIGVLIRHFWKS